MRPEPANDPSPIRGISRNVFLLGLVSLCTDASTEMVYPLIPLFLTGPLHASVSVLGVIEGLAEATASLFKGFSGWASDRLGRRRPLAIGGYGLAALTKPLLAVAAGWPLVLLARVLDRLGKGVRGSPRDALIADSTPAELRGRAFGFHRTADQIGAVIGPLLALPLLAAFQQSFRAVFLVALIPGAIGTAVLFAVRETGSGAQTGRALNFRWSQVSPAFRVFLGLVLLFAIGNSSDVFLILRARQLGFDTGHVVLAFAAFNLTYVLSAYPAGIISDRLGRRRVLVAGYFVFALVYLGFGLVRTPGWVWPLFLVYGLYQGLTDGVTRAFVVDMVPPEHRGSALGLQAMTVGLAAFPASVIAGWLWQHLGPPAPFYYGATTAVLTGVGLAVFLRARAIR